MGVILFSGWYSIKLCQDNRAKTFIFGDNLKGFGKGGQAIIRDEINAYGVPTKRWPSMDAGAFFEAGNVEDIEAVMRRLKTIWSFLQKGESSVVFPVTNDGSVSLGLERAELKQRAPAIYDTIVQHVHEMGEAYGESYVSTEVDLTRIG